MSGLSISGLAKAYGRVRALADLTLDVADGELLVLVGPSGSGKTTALRVLAGLEHADAGTITLDGRDITRAPASKRDVAMVFQSFALFPHLTVRENLAFGPRARRERADDRIAAAADSLGLAGLLDRRPEQLSGGERQRVALGRAMVREPAVFLMDEPLSNLDAQLRAQTRGEIAKLQARLGTTTVYVTHDQVEALSLGHRVGVLRDGILQQVGTPSEVYGTPANTFVARFIGSPPMNIVSATREGNLLLWAGGRVRAPKIAGGDVLLGVRPEHVHVAGSRWSENARKQHAFPARVDLFELVGDQAFVTMDALGVPIVARVEPSFRPVVGELLEAWFEPARLHLFDAVSGERLG